MAPMERYGWIGAFAVLIALAIPWFLWGTDVIVAGLPLWIWWHVAWLFLAAWIFYAFTRRAWGMGVSGVNP